ncbi:hypothetical protein OPV22_029831 [Ensete ventricosum]|uniref:Uncharacterized protein n=1 Tax=Ensete ventricosum TaxID=4639 RepID=A0AAV8Q748_ENSVE|nr:hypothetical protein OPV22_029831 [Ensete ventricosum]
MFKAAVLLVMVVVDWSLLQLYKPQSSQLLFRLYYEALVMQENPTGARSDYWNLSTGIPKRLLEQMHRFQKKACIGDALKSASLDWARFSSVSVERFLCFLPASGLRTQSIAETPVFSFTRLLRNLSPFMT